MGTDKSIVAEVVAAKLKAEGITRVFCLTGGDQSLWIALSDAGIGLVNCRSEASATYLADGFSRVRGGPAVIYGQAGPGVANVAAALAEPYWAQTPLVSLTSAPPSEQRYRNAYQDIDQMAMCEPVTIWSGAVPSPDRTEGLIDRALRIATGPPSGPVHLEISGPMFLREAPPASGRSNSAGNFTMVSPSPAGTAALAEAIMGASRPVVIAGRGVLASGAEGQIAELARSYGIPVGTTLGGKGSIGEAQPLAMGIVGRYSAKVANEILSEADVVLVVGTRLGSMATDTYKLPGPQSRILQIDVSPEVLGNNFPDQTLGVLGDARTTLVALLEHLDATRCADRWKDWSADAVSKVAEWRALRESAGVPDPDRPIQPSAAIRSLRAALPSDSLVFADTGYMAAWAGVLFPLPVAGRYFHRAVGSLGWAFAASLGGAMAAPDRKVACIIGDGGFGYHVGDIETALRHDLAPVIVILNNQSLAFEYHIQKYQYGGRIVPEVNDFVDIDYAAVARAYGAWGRRVSAPEDFDAAIRDAIDQPRLAVLDVLVDKEAVAPVTVYSQHIDRDL